MVPDSGDPHPALPPCGRVGYRVYRTTTDRQRPLPPTKENTVTTTAADLEKYVGKRVVLTRNLSEPDDKGNTAVELVGTVDVANEMGVLFKPKGKTNFELITLAEIEEVSLAPEKEKALTARKLKPVGLGQAKSHLLERHGLTLKEANALSEEAAYAQHEKIDHKAADLGHVHVAESDASEPASEDADSESPSA